VESKDIIDFDQDQNVTDSNATISVRDAQYNETIWALAELAQEASDNDPIVASQSAAMPLHRDGSYRRCKAGACEVGALFLDAMEWYSQADFAFGNSGGFRGPGWPAGPIRISNIWDGLPFPNNLCTGTITGVSMFQLFNYSVAFATFEGENTELGDRLLQVSSGMRLTYNTLLRGGSRLIALEVLDKQRNEYLPVERLQLYKFVTDSFMCTGFRPFSTMLSAESLVYPREEPGQVDPAVLVQEVVADYLQTDYNDKNRIYQPSAQGRMFNATGAATPLNLVQTSDSCNSKEFWDPDSFSCISCPETAGVIFLKELLEFSIEAQQESVEPQSISFVNTLTYPVTVVSRTTPFWIRVEEDESNSNRQSPSGVLWENVLAGETLKLQIIPDATQLVAGTAQGAVIFGVIDEDQFPGCSRPDASFKVTARVDPPEDLNQLGSIRIFGWVLSAIVMCSSLFFMYWVYRHRTTRIVKILQPIFLIMISTGVLVMGSALIPLGFDDEIVSVEACSAACMAFPWLLSIGFTIAMSALFSKLWRINRLFHSRTVRVQIKEKDVLGPFAVLFSINFAALLLWTLLDPLQFERREIDGQPWKTYGSCRPEDGTVTLIMGLIVGVVNFSAFFVACYQAYKARDISDEFSESKTLGVALFSWVQLILIGVPVIFLIEEDNPSARYFISVGLTFVFSMSMLLIIYIPIVIQKHRERLAAMSFRIRSAQMTSNTNVGHRSETRHSSLASQDVRSSAQSRSSVQSRRSSRAQFSASAIGKTRVSGIFDVKKMSAELRNIEGMDSELDDDGRANVDGNGSTDIMRGSSSGSLKASSGSLKMTHEPRIEEEPEEGIEPLVRTSLMMTPLEEVEGEESLTESNSPDQDLEEGTSPMPEKGETTQELEDSSSDGNPADVPAPLSANDNAELEQREENGDEDESTVHTSPSGGTEFKDDDDPVPPYFQ